MHNKLFPELPVKLLWHSPVTVKQSRKNEALMCLFQRNSGKFLNFRRMKQETESKEMTRGTGARVRV